MEFNASQALFNMVEQQIKPWGVLDQKTLDAFYKIPRTNFVTSKYANLAYSDLEIPLPGGGKMLCPRVEARLIQELNLQLSDNVLEIGSGSGYVTALLASQSSFVYSVDKNETNLNFAKDNLIAQGFKNINLALDSDGIPFAKLSPFDKIFIGGALPSIDSKLISLLKVGGLMCGVFGKGQILEACLVERISSNDIKVTKLFETKIDYLDNSTSAPAFRL